MQRRLLPLLEGLRIAEQVEPELHGFLLGIPTEELLDEGQWIEHDQASRQLAFEYVERGRGWRREEVLAFCQKRATSTTTLQTARTAPMTAEDRVGRRRAWDGDGMETLGVVGQAGDAAAVSEACGIPVIVG